MLKSVLSIGAVVALLGTVSLPIPANASNSGVQLAQMQTQDADMRMKDKKGRDGGGHRMREIMDNQNMCNSMMKQFDEANTTSAEAIALRKKAELHCGGSSPATTDRGVSEMKDALNMIGVKPADDQ